MSDFLLTKKLSNFSAVCYVLAFFIMAYFVIMYFQGCFVAPRSETKCLKSGYWVKCPKNIEAGTDISNLKIKKDKE